MGSCALQTQKNCETGVGYRMRQLWCIRVMLDTPKRGPLWIWIGTVCADLVLEVLSPYELLESFLCDCLVHRSWVVGGMKSWVKSNHVGATIMFIGSYSNTLPNSITNLSTPIPSYFFSTLRSVFSRCIYRLQFHAFATFPRCSPAPTTLVDS